MTGSRLEFEVHGARVVSVTMQVPSGPDLIKFNIPAEDAENFAQQLEQLATMVRSAAPMIIGGDMAVRPYVPGVNVCPNCNVGGCQGCDGNGHLPDPTAPLGLVPAAPEGVWRP